MAKAKLPAHPSLEFDRKQAKRRLKSVKMGDKAAIAWLAENHPRYSDSAVIEADGVSLSDTLLAVAREYGFPSWSDWKHFVELSKLARSDKAGRLVSG